MSTITEREKAHGTRTDRVEGGSAITEQLTRLNSWRLWIITAATFGLFAAVFFASPAPFAIPHVDTLCGQAPLDVRFTSSAADVDSFLESCGPAGRDAYRNMQIADLFYPAVFGLFMASSLAIIFRRLFADHQRAVIVAVIPLIGAGFDYVENIFAWSALQAFPDPAATNPLLGMASAAKTTTFWIAGALLLLGALGLGGRRLKEANFRMRMA